jgi:hypothetical protein
LAEFPQISAQPTGEEGGELDAAARRSEPLVVAEKPALTGIVLPQTAVATNSLLLLDADGEIRPLEEIEAEVIRFALAYYHGQMSQVARKLRIGRSTLYRKLENLEFVAAEADEFRPDVALRRHVAARKRVMARIESREPDRTVGDV